jgi:dTDP-4-amino-4,6-dideoxygalactose transaminase
MMTETFSQFLFLRTSQVFGKQHGWYAYVMQFDASRANGVSIDLFTKAVLAEGLVELDRPRSTGTLHQLPLFTQPEKALPRLYSRRAEQRQQSFPVAEQFYENALKLPVWSFQDDEQMVNLYIGGIVKVASVVRDNPEHLLAAEAEK